MDIAYKKLKTGGKLIVAEYFNRVDLYTEVLKRFEKVQIRPLRDIEYNCTPALRIVGGVRGKRGTPWDMIWLIIAEK